jgi:hypothetical protein
MRKHGSLFRKLCVYHTRPPNTSYIYELGPFIRYQVCVRKYTFRCVSFVLSASLAHIDS